MTRALRRALSALALCASGGTMGAQQPVAGGAAATAPLVAPDSIAAFVRPNGGLIRQGTDVYQLTLQRSGGVTPLGVRRVQVTESNAGGAPGWLIAESRTGTAVPTSDSLWLARADLSPERWAATIDHAQLGVSFSRDSAFGAVQSYRGRASFATAVPVGALLTGGMVERVIELLPLREGYRFAATLLLFELGTPRVLDAEIAVARVERTRVGSVDVECWVVALRAGVLEERLWVARQSPRVIRTEQATQGGVLVGSVVP